MLLKLWIDAKFVLIIWERKIQKTIFFIYCMDSRSIHSHIHHEFLLFFLHSVIWRILLESLLIFRLSRRTWFIQRFCENQKIIYSQLIIIFFIFLLRIFQSPELWVRYLIIPESLSAKLIVGSLSPLIPLLYDFTIILIIFFPSLKEWSIQFRSLGWWTHYRWIISNLTIGIIIGI